MLAAGDLILLIDKVGRRYRVRLAAGEQFSMHAGAIAHDDLIGRPEGVVVATQRGSRCASTSYVWSFWSPSRTSILAGSSRNFCCTARKRRT